MKSTPLFVAIDTTDLGKAARTAHMAAEHGVGVKLGLEFFLGLGRGGYEAVARAGAPVFLDLKLHDIPNTVAGAVRALAALEPRYLTLHTSGGSAMMARAAAAAKEHMPNCRLLGVTVLTSMDAQDMAATGLAGDPAEQVLRLGQLAQKSGIDGLVCGASEVGMLRSALGPDIHLLVPGIRPAGSAAGDQKRTMTPANAIAAGATALVVGRPITEADDPAAALAAILAETAL